MVLQKPFMFEGTVLANLQRPFLYRNKPLPGPLTAPTCCASWSLPASPRPCSSGMPAPFRWGNSSGSAWPAP